MTPKGQIMFLLATFHIEKPCLNNPVIQSEQTSPCTVEHESYDRVNPKQINNIMIEADNLVLIIWYRPNSINLSKIMFDAFIH